jgi:E3 ubiquitin-protein ligase SIAH1
MNKKCPSCNEPIGDSRCRAMEKILAGMTRLCKYSKYGCCDVVKFTEMRVHEEACPYAPYRCPFNCCNYDGVLLYDHILHEHDHATEVQVTSDDIGKLHEWRVTLQKGSPFHALLHRDEKSIFILLNGGDVLTGRSLSLVRVCPRPVEEEAKKVNYVHMDVSGHGPGSLSLMAPVQYVRRLEGYLPERFLFVPGAFWGSSGSITVTVYI